VLACNFQNISASGYMFLPSIILHRRIAIENHSCDG